MLIATTNAGAREMNEKVVGEAGATGPDVGARRSRRSSGRSPEFRNRLDAIIQFKGLSREVILQVVDKEIAALQAALDEKKVRVALTDAARNLAPARRATTRLRRPPMARLVETSIKALAEALLFGDLGSGGTARRLSPTTSSPSPSPRAGA